MHTCGTVHNSRLVTCSLCHVWHAGQQLNLSTPSFTPQQPSFTPQPPSFTTHTALGFTSQRPIVHNTATQFYIQTTMGKQHKTHFVTNEGAHHTWRASVPHNLERKWKGNGKKQHKRRESLEYSLYMGQWPNGFQGIGFSPMFSLLKPTFSLPFCPFSNEGRLAHKERTDSKRQLSSLHLWSASKGAQMHKHHAHISAQVFGLSVNATPTEQYAGARIYTYTHTHTHMHPHPHLHLHPHTRTLLHTHTYTHNLNNSISTHISTYSNKLVPHQRIIGPKAVVKANDERPVWQK